MIYLLFGEDKYRRDLFFVALKKKLGIEKDSINITTHRGSFDIKKITIEATSMPFLADKRIVVLDGALSSKDKTFLDSFADWVGQAPDYCDVVLLEETAPDKRLRITKAIEKYGNINEFKSMSPGEVIQYIKQRAETIGAKIEPKAINDLQFACGNDLNTINNELEKLKNYNPNITEESVDLLVDAGYFNRIFDLTDAISMKNTERALFHLNKLLGLGEEPVAILGMISNQIRNLILVSDLSSHGLSEYEIQSRSKLHQFVVKKSVSQIKNFSKEDLLSFHHELLRADILIKTSSAEAKTIVERLVMSISKKEA